MNALHAGPLKLRADIERWPFLTPFRISGYTFESLEVLLVTLEKDGHRGCGEAAGVYYRNDKPIAMIEQIHALRGLIELGIDHSSVQSMLPPGGARNALDCALWNLEAQLLGCPVWQLAKLKEPQPILTTIGCGADTPERMAAVAKGYTHAQALKLKLTGDAIDCERVCAVRKARPDVWLGIDANQGFDRAFLEHLMPTLVEARVSLIEQPFPVGDEALLDDFDSPIPIAADESVQGLSDLAALVDRFDVVNIKLDKCGGLTEGLAMAHAACQLGMKAMVGNMFGTSLAMAPAFLVGQLCSIVDLDGPLFLRTDRAPSMQYRNGMIMLPDAMERRKELKQ